MWSCTGTGSSTGSAVTSAVRPGRPVLLLVHGLGGSSATWQRGPARAGAALHGRRTGSPRARGVRQAEAGLLPRRPRQRRPRPDDRDRDRPRHGGRPVARRRHRDATRVPAPATLRAARARVERWTRIRGLLAPARAQPARCRVPHAGALPVLRARRRQRGESTTPWAGAARTAPRGGMAHVRIAHRTREPALVRAHAPIGRRPERPVGQRTRPPLPGVAGADPDRLGPRTTG